MANQASQKTAPRQSGKKGHPKKSQRKGVEMPFGRENFILMAVGFAIIIIGYILMSGDTNIYSFRKITLAPLVVMAGYALEVYAILKTPSSRKSEAESQEDNN